MLTQGRIRSKGWLSSVLCGLLVLVGHLSDL